MNKELILSQTEIKQEIYSRLDSTNDDSILEIVYDILANGILISDDILTNPILNQKIDRGLDDIKHGRLMSDEQANKKLKNG